MRILPVRLGEFVPKRLAPPLKRLVPEELPCIEPALPPPKRMLSMLMFNAHQFYHAAAVGTVKLRLIALVDVVADYGQPSIVGLPSVRVVGAPPTTR